MTVHYIVRGGLYMKITKKNGNITVYDDERLIRSILRANAEVPTEELSETQAARIADKVFAKLTAGNNIITTAEIRTCMYETLLERGLRETARHYMEYAK